MLPANDLRTILNAADEAMARDDAASAERLMRDALALQESIADTPRDEIARTLNNLAIVCEMTGKIGDAETCYRRAHTIALATLPASDPFVTTSRENLEEFCKARGLTVDRPAPAPAASSAPAVDAVPLEDLASEDFAPEPAPEPEPAPAPAAVPASTRSAVPVHAPVPVPAPKPDGSRLMIAGVIAVIVVGIVIVAARMWSAPRPASNITAPVATRAPEPARAPEPTPAPEPAPAPAPASAPTPAPPPAPVVTTQPEPPRPVTKGPLPGVTSAQICRSLVTRGEWTCDEASGTVPPGMLYFYTRVASAVDTTVEHRWYLRDRLHQRVQLHIGPNQSGFRTYSRTTISAERAGPWKVELRSADGRVLHEDNFIVR